MDEQSALTDKLMLREDNFDPFEKPPEPIVLFYYYCIVLFVQSRLKSFERI